MQAIHDSCGNGWRKDGGEAWRRLPQLEGVHPQRWLHVGDNEHADVQLPQAMGFIHPVHALRSSALLDLVPALRPLRPDAAQREVLERFASQTTRNVRGLDVGVMRATAVMSPVV